MDGRLNPISGRAPVRTLEAAARLCYSDNQGGGRAVIHRSAKTFLDLQRDTVLSLDGQRDKGREARINEECRYFEILRKKHLAGERYLKSIQFRVSDLSLNVMYFHDIMAGIQRVYYCYRMFPMICVEEL